jgi:hypothetical protein
VRVAFETGRGRLTALIDGLPVAVYTFEDPDIPRPYFAHVRAMNGVQVTRSHPPIDGQDLVDHPEFHPGIWMAFGDISGSDYWRNKARVRHAEFFEKPTGGNGGGSFTVRNEYFEERLPHPVVCEELARYTFVECPRGWLLTCDSTFTSKREFVFGDQEEMGLGFRIATPLRVGASGDAKIVAGNGTILDAEGRKNGEQVGGQSSQWCDFSGTIAGQRVGMTLFCHPENCRPSWFHARDYGLVVANPFGRNAFGHGDKSAVTVKPGEEFRLRYGILVHSSPEDEAMSMDDHRAAYERYLKLSEK